MSETITRSFLLDDLVVRTEGEGRTVEAYAAVFDTTAEIRDRFGHYLERIHPTAFNVALNRTRQQPRVLFNHGLDLYGKPSDRFAMPIGTPEQITADARGLRTVTRIVKTPLGDEVLELMRSGAIDGFSFQGAPLRSQRIAASGDEKLPTIVRQQLGLTEYGPGVFVAYSDARVLAMRTQDLADELGELPVDQLAELVDVLRSRITDPAVGRSVTPGDADDTGQQAAAGEFDHQRRLMAARLRGLTP